MHFQTARKGVGISNSEGKGRVLHFGELVKEKVIQKEERGKVTGV